MDEKVREIVRRRANNRCEYCLLPELADEWPFHIEHVIAKQHGGRDDVENLCLACSRCNLHKGPNIASLDRETGQLTSLFNPRMQSWDDNFKFRDERIVGLTAVGKVTV